MNYDEYRAVGRFDALQTLRTLCVVGTITWHMRDPMWPHFRGYLGVSIFFVVSGFLITTLLLREEEAKGSISLGAFYVRRAFRLLPLYYLVLIAFGVGIFVLGWYDGSAPSFKEALPFYLTYQQEFAPKAPYGQVWSLGIEEKFYVLWPLVLVGLGNRPRLRLAAAVALLALAWGAQLLGLPQLPFYTAILAGVVVALAMHSRRGYDLLAFARRPSFGILAVAAGCLAAALATQGSFASRTNLAVGFAAALPMIVTARGPLGDLLSLRPLVVLGAYTYAAYLVHPLAIGITDRLIDYGQVDPTVQLQRLTIATALSFFAAAVLFHTFEKPLIRVGHRLAHRPKQLESVNPG